MGHPEWKPQRAVFVADDDQAIWIVENPEAVKNFPAAHVMMEAKFDSARKMIHVEKITRVAGQCIMKERPASEGRSRMRHGGPPLRYAVQGFAPLRRRLGVTAVVCPVRKDYRRA